MTNSLRNAFAPANNNQPQSVSLEVESLEDRMMLSTVTIYAAGATGTEDMKLMVNDQVIKTFKNIGGDVDARDFQAFTWNLDGTVASDEIKIRFSNDLYEPENGIDRNLTVDRIVLDGATYQTESSRVFSTGTWTSEDGIVPGFGRGETLHANGYFKYGPSDVVGTQLSVTAQGQGGDAAFDILIDGQVVASFVAGSELATFNYFHSEEVTADQIRVAFTNDQYDEATGLDVNLLVDFVGVGNTGYSTNDASVFSTGTWLPTDFVTPGYGRGNVLHTNGYFQFADFDNNSEALQLIDQIGDSGLIIEVDEAFGNYATLSVSGANSSGDVINMYLPDGQPDTSFGGDGSVNIRDLTGLDPGNDFAISDLSFYPDGSLLLTGRNFNFVGVSVPYLLKLRPNGVVDNSFNNGFFTNTLLGISQSDSGDFYSLVDFGGGTTLVGKVFDSPNDMVLIRLNDNGQVDTGWGFGGTQRISGSGTGRFPRTGLIGADLAADGGILVAYARENDISFVPTFVTKVDADGFVDTSYGNNGVATIDSPEQFASFSQFQVDSQDRAVLVGSRYMARLNFSGNLDTSFNSTGVRNYADFQSVEDGLEPFQGADAFVIDARDRIVITSNIRTSTGRFSFNYDGTTVLRFDVDGSFDTRFEDEGIQALAVSSLEFTGTNRQIALDSEGNLLISTGPLGPNTDPANNVRTLSRYAFAPYTD